MLSPSQPETIIFWETEFSVRQLKKYTSPYKKQDLPKKLNSSQVQTDSNIKKILKKNNLTDKWPRSWHPQRGYIELNSVPNLFRDLFQSKYTKKSMPKPLPFTSYYLWELTQTRWDRQPNRLQIGR